jgi:hypothetical protein
MLGTYRLPVAKEITQAGKLITGRKSQYFPQIRMLKEAVFLLRHLQVQTPDQHRCTMWQTTDRNDGGVQRQAVTSGKLALPDPPTYSQASQPSFL